MYENSLEQGFLCILLGTLRTAQGKEKDFFVYKNKFKNNTQSRRKRYSSRVRIELKGEK